MQHFHLSGFPVPGVQVPQVIPAGKRHLPALPRPKEPRERQEARPGICQLAGILLVAESHRAPRRSQVSHPIFPLSGMRNAAAADPPPAGTAVEHVAFTT